MQTGHLIGALTALAITAVVAVMPVGGGRAYAAPQQLWLRGAGATFPAPLYKKWADVYHQQNPSTSVTYDSVGSGEGISRFVTGSVDFGASDTVLSDTETTKVAAGVVMIPATAGMIVVAYNVPGLKGPLRLPRDVYPDIFAGRITELDDPRLQAANPGLALPNRNLAVIARLDSSGTTAAFTTHLDAVSATWRNVGLGTGKLIAWPAQTMLARGNEGVSARIKIAENSIGYVEYGFAKRLNLPVAALQNKAGAFVMPSDESGLMALAEATVDGMRMTIDDPVGERSYPIVTYSWMLLYQQYADPMKAAAIKSFVGWGLTGGQAYGEALGYIRLPSTVVAKGEAALASIR